MGIVTIAVVALLSLAAVVMVTVICSTVTVVVAIARNVELGQDAIHALRDVAARALGTIGRLKK